MRTFGFQWHLTDRCNSRCAHCYQESFGVDAELPAEARSQLADRIFGALEDRRLSVNLTGGEPLLLPDLAELVEQLQRFENLEEIWIITNGTLADPALLRRLTAGARPAGFKISLEAADDSLHDSIRGAGSLARLRAALPAFRATGAPLVAMLTLGRHNLGAIGPALAWARGEGFAGLIVERFVPLGRGSAHRDWALDAAGWTAALAEVAEAAGTALTPEELLGYEAFWLYADPAAREPLRGARCNLGDESMALMPDGTVYPCRRLPLPLGNALLEPFDRLLERLAGFAPERLRAGLRGELCGQCGVEGCAGCRALARALTGDELADDPCCPLRLA